MKGTIYGVFLCYATLSQNNLKMNSTTKQSIEETHRRFNRACVQMVHLRSKKLALLRMYEKAASEGRKAFIYSFWTSNSNCRRRV
jgi:hypothetical protein